jgi:hypothetical protein
MAHGDAEVVKNDATGVTVSPPVTITTTKGEEADSKKGPYPEGGKSNLLTSMFRYRLSYSELVMH